MASEIIAKNPKAASCAQHQSSCPLPLPPHACLPNLGIHRARQRIPCIPSWTQKSSRPTSLEIIHNTTTVSTRRLQLHCDVWQLNCCKESRKGYWDKLLSNLHLWEVSGDHPAPAVSEAHAHLCFSFFAERLRETYTHTQSSIRACL